MNAVLSEAAQLSLIWRNSLWSLSIRCVCALIVSIGMTQRSSGMPTDRFERSVESIETSTAFTASSIEVSGRITRSRIGLPYLCSPIWR